MLIALPLSAFTIGSKSVLSCKIVIGKPFDFLHRRMQVYISKDANRSIYIKGISTATIDGSIYDYEYSGEAFDDSDIGCGAIMTDVSYEQACIELGKFSADIRAKIHKDQKLNSEKSSSSRLKTPFE